MREEGVDLALSDRRKVQYSELVILPGEWVCTTGVFSSATEPGSGAARPCLELSAPGEGVATQLKTQLGCLGRADPRGRDRDRQGPRHRRSLLHEELGLQVGRHGHCCLLHELQLGLRVHGRRGHRLLLHQQLPLRDRVGLRRRRHLKGVEH